MVLTKKEMMISDRLEIFTHHFSKWAGSASGFVAALLSILVLFLAGSRLRIFSGLGTWIIDLYWRHYVLMVFLIQRGQNKELSILQVKLNELIAATKNADNRLIM